ncbi:DUF3558 domain-containing protein [Nocardia salmonicida]|uniref:DUF3558 domain-containing protein n=1 Tax=Nocardia salmonicida TaxID=53431 RepID=UPI0033CD093B
MRYWKLITTISAVGALVLPAGCADESPDPPDTTSTQYLATNVFNPCRQVPTQFLADYRLGAEAKGANNTVENYSAVGCAYAGAGGQLSVAVSNAPLSELGRETPNAFAPNRIAGRPARIMTLPQERRFCRLDVQIAGGILALTLSGDPSGDNCAVLTAMAEKLVPQLPEGA